MKFIYFNLIPSLSLNKVISTYDIINPILYVIPIVSVTETKRKKRLVQVSHCVNH